MSISFSIPGKPVSKPRMTQSDSWRKPPRKCVAQYREFADKIREYASTVQWKEESGLAYSFSIKFVFEFPKSYSKKKCESLVSKPYLQKPDIDNLVKAILDPLFEADQKVWALDRIEKIWDDGLGARIEIQIDKFKLE